MDLEEFVKFVQIAKDFNNEYIEVKDSYRRQCSIKDLTHKIDNWTASSMFKILAQEKLDRLLKYQSCLEYFKCHTPEACIRNADYIIADMSDEDLVTLSLLGIFNE
ncbi:hypothetical protein NVP2275O_246 [Vibrio phage 2.275.O._10N.286.54.E11]|nr:hypothetical protein NVP2275O_246 [Vibrio phage 2.275.O._10N.286.54.E11]